MLRPITTLALALLAACGPSGQATTTAPPQATPPTVTRQMATAAATPQASAAAAQAGQLGQASIALERMAQGLDSPTFAVGDGGGRLFVVEKTGKIQLFAAGTQDPKLFLDIVDRVGSNESERGLLSVAFHPQFAQNGLLYVDYTDRAGDTVIARFHASGDSADPASEQVLLTIQQPYANHNGGQIAFGPDGYLYIGMGDGGSAGDPQGNGQNPDALLGKLLRIDVDGGQPYAIPADNPFAKGGGKGEIWAVGLRNPWRFSFDRATGDLYIADVGQNKIEEIDFQAAGAGAGANYGWNATEGDECYQRGCDLAAYVAPVAQYTHAEGCSVTGGYVYRGERIPALQGTYLYADYCSGTIWGLQRDAGGAWQQRVLLTSGLQISSFGQDDAGELYLTTLDDDSLYQIVGT
ncbi:PQQ-dependent sugar dehydrogenase [Chloroflexia bacterium SDU3-3]|nr:PQQ-dependent sugar dehydrogenase [Chloroflexia bacterium SDU3-3]